MKIGIVIYAKEPEVVWNAFRFANVALKEGDEVRVFLLADGVAYESLTSEAFNIVALAESFAASGGVILACGTCIAVRQQKKSNICPISTMQDLYTIVKESDKVVTF